ncbi:MAG: VCBS repeat-containing protein [Candidatus Hydrogenedentes bacterium]|nr:VCBS repeat-containing protein [Candidatus Hydrogenedentota bacterium]
MRFRTHISRDRVLIAVLLFVAASFQSRAELFTKYGKWFNVGPNPCSIAAADLNGDGLPEIVTADRGSMTNPREERPANDELSYLESQGNLEYLPKPPLKAGFAPYAVVLANIDALKALDIVTVCFHEPPSRRRHLTLFRNLGEEGFEALNYAVPETDLQYHRILDNDGVPIYTVPGLTSLTVRDFNRDGYRDVVATGWSSDVLVYFPGDKTSYFGAPVMFPCEGGPRDVQAADFDGDGELDLAVALYSSGDLAFFRGDGKGGFAEATRIPSRGPLPLRLVARDMNGDDKTDLVVAHCFTSDSVVVFYGDGGFSFSVTQEVEVGKENNRAVVEHEIRDLVVEDFNGDNKVDMAVACRASRQVVVFSNQSAPSASRLSFGREEYPYKDAQPYALCSADFNADEKPDLAVTLWGPNAVALLLGK